MANQKAFPVPNDYHRDGMDLRDYFACAALTGMIDLAIEDGLKAEEIVERAYKIADTMMIHRRPARRDDL